MNGAHTRPRFVVALCGAAAIMIVYEVVQLASTPIAYYRETWIGVRMAGWPAIVASGFHIALCAIVGHGLWRLKAWSRIAAMAYLAFVLVSFLLVGVKAYRGGRVVAVMMWQMFVLPFVTFCFMYLYGGKRSFRG